MSLSLPFFVSQNLFLHLPLMAIALYVHVHVMSCFDQLNILHQHLSSFLSVSLSCFIRFHLQQCLLSSSSGSVFPSLSFLSGFISGIVSRRMSTQFGPIRSPGRSQISPGTSVLFSAQQLLGSFLLEPSLWNCSLYYQ